MSRRSGKGQATPAATAPTWVESDTPDKGSPPSSPMKKPTPYTTEKDFIDFFYEPHTILFGTFAFSVVIYAYLCNPSYGVEANVKMGLIACAWAWLWFGTIQLPDGAMIRPHPAVWRFVCACALMYLLFMIFLIFQDRETRRFLVGQVDPKSLLPVVQKSYADDCRISTPEEPYLWVSLIFDEFLIAHAVGYIIKAIIIRDWRIVIAISLLFEVMEVTFQHMLENFKECWWDHLIADVLICNGGGMLIGLLICHYFSAKQYDWVKPSRLPNVAAKMKRVALQFTPRSFGSQKWEMFRDWRRFLQVLALITILMVQELNAFFLKDLLNLDTTSPLTIGRLGLWAAVAAPGFREFYEFITDPKCKRIGTIAWVGVAGLLFETLWIFKLAGEEGRFTKSAPPHILVPWIYAIFALTLWFVLYFGSTGFRQKKGVLVRVWKVLLTVLFHSSWLALLALCLMGNEDTQWGQKEFDFFVLTLTTRGQN